MGYCLKSMIVLTVLVSLRVEAFPCIMTVAKDSCWTNYGVTVVVSDLSTHKPMATLSMPKGKSWVRQQFDCQPQQVLVYEASFLPPIWEEDQGKLYRGSSFWNLPSAVYAGQRGWELKVCYAKDFSEAPMPLEARGGCQCDFSKIPPAMP